LSMRCRLLSTCSLDRPLPSELLSWLFRSAFVLLNSRPDILVPATTWEFTSPIPTRPRSASGLGFVGVKQQRVVLGSHTDPRPSALHRSTIGLTTHRGSMAADSTGDWVKVADDSVVEGQRLHVQVVSEDVSPSVTLSTQLPAVLPHGRCTWYSTMGSSLLPTCVWVSRNTHANVPCGSK
jgi:hypothetical protein